MTTAVTSSPAAFSAHAIIRQKEGSSAHMRAEEKTDTIKLALAASGSDQAVMRHKPRLLSDNGSCSISDDLAE